MARWTQQDPSGQDANPYLYVAANPTNLVDPTGEFPWVPVIATGLVVAQVAPYIVALHEGYKCSKGDEKACKRMKKNYPNIDPHEHDKYGGPWERRLGPGFPPPVRR